MKKIRFIVMGLLLFIFNITLAQSFEEAFKKKEVETAPIFPGCQEYEGNNQDLMKCLVKELHKLIGKNLNTDFPWTSTPKKILAVKAKFVINPMGEIEDVEAVKGDSELMEQVENVFYKVSSYLKDKNLKIEPARKKDGTAVDLSLTQNIKLRNPGYARDLIRYYNSIGYTPNEIESELRRENIFKYNEQQISRIIERN
ncbi:energy transducer TonB [Weeksellaceae bacterium TAE3-ERU29]|nr:energy transducer TonB [Weeksellaceae bacterium TAE3-ERU29]